MVRYYLKLKNYFVDKNSDVKAIVVINKVFRKYYLAFKYIFYFIIY